MSGKARSGLKLTMRASSPVRFGLSVGGWVSDCLAICHFSNFSLSGGSWKSSFAASLFPPWQEDIAASYKGKSSYCAAFPFPLNLAASPYRGKRRRSGGFPNSQQEWCATRALSLLSGKARSGLKLTMRAYSPARFGVSVGGCRLVWRFAISQFSL